jgi:hypothetical protein
MTENGTSLPVCPARSHLGKSGLLANCSITSQLGPSRHLTINIRMRAHVGRTQRRQERAKKPADDELTFNAAS